MPRFGLRFSVVTNPRPNWIESHGPGPYFWLDEEFNPGEWDRIVAFGIEQVALLHRASGAILAKHAKDNAQT